METPEKVYKTKGYADNLEENRRKARERYHANREKCIQAASGYYWANREKVIKYITQYREKHRQHLKIKAELGMINIEKKLIKRRESNTH